MKLSVLFAILALVLNTPFARAAAPCQAFLSAQPVTAEQIARLHERLLFETKDQWLSLRELAEMLKEGKSEPSKLFTLSGSGPAERAVIQQALTKLWTLVHLNSIDQVEISQKIIQTIERRIEYSQVELHIQEATNIATAVIPITKFKIPGFLAQASKQKSDQVFVTTDKSRVEVWDTIRAKVVVNLPPNYHFTYPEFLAGGNRIASWTRSGGTSTGHFRVFDIFTQDWIKVSERAAKELSYFTVSPNGKYVLSDKRDKTPLVWNSETDQLIELSNPSVAKIDNVKGAWRVSYFLPDNRIVTYDGTHLHYWDAETGELNGTVLNTEIGASIDTRSRSADGRFWFTDTEVLPFGPRRIQIWDMVTGHSIYSEVSPVPTRAHLFSPTNNSIILLRGQEVETIDLATKESTFRLNGELNPNIRGSIADIALSSNGRYLVVQTKHESRRQTLQLWDVLTKRFIFELKRVEGPDELHGLHFSRDDKNLIVTESYKSSDVWNIEQVILEHDAMGAK